MKKILIFAGIGAVLIILSLIFMNMTSKDTTKPEIEAIYKTTSTTLSLSKLGQENASNYSLKVIAVNIATTSASDVNAIAGYYQTRYGKAIKLKKPSKEELAADPSTLLEAKEEGVDFDSEYIKSTRTQLETNLNQIRSLYSSTERADLRTMLETVFNNTEKNLELLKKFDTERQ
jgi:hypothetical protein